MVSPALRFPLTNCRSASILLKKKSAGLRCEIFRNCLAAKNKNLTNKLLKVISGGQTGVDRGALDAALALQVECGGWCPEGRLAEDGVGKCRVCRADCAKCSRFRWHARYFKWSSAWRNS